ncbi:hypothetical protein RAS1_12400 [Phycisphaerae bacterium RAS1]|nr:hypothetical protein RAS1_12400 [Phycisphaerae bacterium RAS1]
MKSKLSIALILLAAVDLATATDYTFQPQSGNSGTWSVNGNWTPNGRPGTGDTATIPTGKTCIVSSQNEAITTLTIASGAVVRVSGRDLTLVSYGSTQPAISLSGKIEMEKPSSVMPRLLVSGTLTFSGDGSIQASVADNLGPAEVTGTDVSTRVVDFGTVTVRGSIQFTEYLNLRDGFFVVDCADDTMLFGTLSTPTEFSYILLSGEPAATVSDGTIRFGTAITHYAYTTIEGKFYVQGGLMEFTRYGFHVSSYIGFEVSDGELKFGDQAGVGAWNGIDFSGGQIRLGGNATAVFGDLN